MREYTEKVREFFLHPKNVGEIEDPDAVGEVGSIICGDALKVTNQNIVEYLGGLPKEKMHCSVMGREALEAAIANYRDVVKPPEVAEKIICSCFGVSEEKIRRVAIENHLTTVEETTNYTKAGGGRGSCISNIGAILKDI